MFCGGGGGMMMQSGPPRMMMEAPGARHLNPRFSCFLQGADGSGQTPLYAPRITVAETNTAGGVGANSPYRLNSQPHLTVPSAEGGLSPGSPSYLSPCYLTVPPAGSEGGPGAGGSVSAPTSPYSRRNNPPSPHLSVPDPPPGPAHHSAGSSPYHLSTPPPYPNQGSEDITAPEFIDTDFTKSLFDEAVELHQQQGQQPAQQQQQQQQQQQPTNVQSPEQLSPGNQYQQHMSNSCQRQQQYQQQLQQQQQQQQQAQNSCLVQQQLNRCHQPQAHSNNRYFEQQGLQQQQQQLSNSFQQLQQYCNNNPLQQYGNNQLNYQNISQLQQQYNNRILQQQQQLQQSNTLQQQHNSSLQQQAQQQYRHNLYQQQNQQQCSGNNALQQHCGTNSNIQQQQCSDSNNLQQHQEKLAELQSLQAEKLRRLQQLREYRLKQRKHRLHHLNQQQQQHKQHQQHRQYQQQRQQFLRQRQRLYQQQQQARQNQYRMDLSRGRPEVTSTTAAPGAHALPGPSGVNANISHNGTPHSAGGPNHPMRGPIGQPMVAGPVGVASYRLPVSQPITGSAPVANMHPPFINPSAVGPRMPAMRPGPVSPMAASMATGYTGNTPGSMGIMTTNLATSAHQQARPSVTMGNAPISSAPVPQMSRGPMIRNPAPQVLNVPKVPTPPGVIMRPHPPPITSQSPLQQPHTHQSHQGMTAQSFHSQISPRCRLPAAQPPPAHSPVNIESISFSVSGQAVDMTKRTASPQLGVGVSGASVGAVGGAAPGGGDDEQGIDLSKHARDTDSVMSSDSDLLKPHPDVPVKTETEAERFTLPVVVTDVDASCVSYTVTMAASSLDSDCKPDPEDMEIKLEVVKEENSMTTTSYTGEVSMATNDFVATMDESALPPLHVTPEDGAEGGEQLSEIDRRLREKVKREKERERKRKLETDKLETLEASSAKSLCSRPEVTDQKLVASSGDGDGPVMKTSVRYTEDSVPVEYDEVEFVWDAYLEETGALPAPPTAFTHVEHSLESGFVKGMKVEVPVKGTEPTSYWMASIVMSCGQLLRLRYDGYHNNSSADFWCDVKSQEVHPIGWCQKNGKTMQPPQSLCDVIGSDIRGFLDKVGEGAASPPEYLLEGKVGCSPIEQIQTGMRLEVQHEINPRWVWIVRVMENIGGRLLLRFEGTDKAKDDFWLFYLHHRLHPIGWCKDNDAIYKPPEVIHKDHPEVNEWTEILEAALKEAEEMVQPTKIFNAQAPLRKHKMKEGWKVEVLHPRRPSDIVPGTITKIIDEFYFLVRVDDWTSDAESHKIHVCCHGGTNGVFPINWCLYKGLRVCTPRGWKHTDFDWTEYLKECQATAAPDSAFTNLSVVENDFVRGMKLEASNPHQPGQICAATITRIIDNLMWISLDGSPKMMPNHIVDVESMDIFPVGWCESNNYPLKPPRKLKINKGRGPGKQIAVVQPEVMSADDYRSATYSEIHAGGHAWCPKIYFNHKCFSGPYLSKGRIAELPKCVGPGPVILVMKEVLSMLINVAYKSSRVLRELQMEGIPNPNMHQQLLKAKYKGKSYRATVEICRATDQIEEFCRQICIRLECCPNMFSPHYVNDSCPENCSQLTKTKYTYYYGKKKKRKPGRPPGGHTNLENGPGRPKKKRGRKKKEMSIMNQREKRSSVDSDDTVISETLKGEDDVFDDDAHSVSDKSSVKTDSSSLQGGFQDDGDLDFKPPRKKRKYVKHVPPPSMIKTRGAKLPKFTFEKRTHRKIALPSSSPQKATVRPQRQTHYKPEVKAKAEVEDFVPPKHHHVHHPPKHRPKMDSTTGVESTYRLEDTIHLKTNPLYWSVNETIQFLQTTDCAQLARLFREQEIDGQALLLLTLPDVQEHLDLKLGPAVKLCHHVERVKVAFYEQFA